VCASSDAITSCSHCSVVLKSRLLKPLAAGDGPTSKAQSQAAPARRTSDRKQVQETAAPIELAQTPALTATTQPVQSAPRVSGRLKGRLLVATILLICVCTGGYLLWSTFLQNAGYGVVAGTLTAISAPWPGTLTTLYVRQGDIVRQGDLLAVVDDPELQASIDRFADKLRGAQADLDAQAALLTLAARERGIDAEEFRAKFWELSQEHLVHFGGKPFRLPVAGTWVPAKMVT